MTRKNAFVPAGATRAHGSARNLTLPPTKQSRSWRTGQCPAPLALPLVTPPSLTRVKLYNKGNEISDRTRTAKLKREYRRLRDLKLLIFFMDLGKEGAHHREKMVRQRKVARMIAESTGTTVEKALKMVNKSVETQEKSNASKSQRSSRSSGSSRLSSSKSKHRRGTGGYSRYSSNRRQQTSSRTSRNCFMGCLSQFGQNG